MVLNSDDLRTSQNSSLPKLGYINLLHFLDLSQFFAMRVAHIATVHLLPREDQWTH